MRVPGWGWERRGMRENEAMVDGAVRNNGFGKEVAAGDLAAI